MLAFSGRYWKAQFTDRDSIYFSHVDNKLSARESARYQGALQGSVYGAHSTYNITSVINFNIIANWPIIKLKGNSIICYHFLIFYNILIFKQVMSIFIF